MAQLPAEWSATGLEKTQFPGGGAGESPYPGSPHIQGPSGRLWPEGLIFHECFQLGNYDFAQIKLPFGYFFSKIS